MNKAEQAGVGDGAVRGGRAWAVPRPREERCSPRESFRWQKMIVLIGSMFCRVPGMQQVHHHY